MLERGLILSLHLLLLLLFIVILIMAVGDLLWSLWEKVGGLDLTDGAGQLVPLALHLFEVDVVAVPCGQWRLCVDDADVSVLHR